MNAETFALLLRLGFFVRRLGMRAAAAQRAAVSCRCCSQARFAGVNQLTPTGATSATPPSLVAGGRCEGPPALFRADTGAAPVVPTGGVSHPDSVSESVSVTVRDPSLDSAPASRARPGASPDVSTARRAGPESGGGPASPWVAWPSRALWSGPASAAPHASRSTRRLRRLAGKGSSGSAGAVGGAAALAAPGGLGGRGAVPGPGGASTAGSSGVGGSGAGSGRGMMRRSARGCVLSP
mmetsp:Transcript_36476/g.87705  ORF Transcript_36476/g.87705 Transcript_36476/m.87705 type:complete len:238 (-) Transcript_36476:431-1144(-)